MTNRRIVAVDGLDGSGKSQFAAALAAACAAGGVAATVLHVDDFRREIDFAGLDADAEAALYYERYFDLAALDGKLASFARAGGRRRLAIVEGVFTLRVPTVAAAAALVALTVSPDEARRRISRATARRDARTTRSTTASPTATSRRSTLPGRLRRPEGAPPPSSTTTTGAARASSATRRASFPRPSSGCSRACRD